MRKLLPVLLVSLLTACNAAAQGDTVLLLPQDSARHLAELGLEGPAAATQVVLRTAEEWDSVWRGINRNRVYPAAPPAPPVDFTHEMVLLAGLGHQATTGFTIRIDTVVIRRDTLRVIIHSVAPQCLAGMVMTYPWDAVRVPRTDLVVQFVKRPVIDQCR